VQNVPSNGILGFELESSDNDATNNFAVSIQLPDGRTPMNLVRIPAGGATGLAGVLDDREMLRASYLVGQGGHCVFSCTEAGSAELTWRVTFKGR